MTIFFKVLDILKKIDYRFLSLIVVCLFPVYKFNIASISIFVLIGTCLIYFIKNREKVHVSHLKPYLYNSSFFLLLAASLLYTNDLSTGFKILQHGLSILIFPIVIFAFLPEISRRNKYYLLYTFVTACIILTLYIYYELSIQEAFESWMENEIKFWNNPFRNVLFNLRYLELHPTYYSLWILFSALILLDISIKQWRCHKMVSFYILISLVFGLAGTALFFSARGPILGFAIAALCLVLLNIKTFKNRVFVFLLSVVLIVASFTQISFLKSRFIDEFDAQKFRPPVGNAHTPTNIRVGIYQCVMEISRTNFLFGIGVGDVQTELNSCYSNYHTRVYEEKDYNTHNSYFNLLLSVGFIGLVAFLTVLGYQFRWAIRTKSTLYLAFLVLVSISMLFENLLIRMHGAVFFGLFNAIFVKELLEKKYEGDEKI